MEEKRANKKLMMREMSKRKILFAAAKLFSTYGYSETTTRMISEKAGVVLSSLNHYFGSKEKILEEVLDMETLLIKNSFMDINEKVKVVLAQENPDSEECYQLILELLERHIRNSFNGKNKVILDLVEKECLFPEGLNHRISLQVCESIEVPLTKLLMRVVKDTPEYEIISLTRSINGAITSFAEKPELLKDLYQSLGFEAEMTLIQSQIFSIVTKQIQNYM